MPNSQPKLKQTFSPSVKTMAGNDLRPLPSFSAKLTIAANSIGEDLNGGIDNIAFVSQPFKLNRAKSNDANSSDDGDRNQRQTDERLIVAPPSVASWLPLNSIDTFNHPTTTTAGSNSSNSNNTTTTATNTTATATAASTNSGDEQPAYYQSAYWQQQPPPPPVCYPIYDSANYHAADGHHFAGGQYYGGGGGGGQSAFGANNSPYIQAYESGGGGGAGATSIAGSQARGVWAPSGGGFGGHGASSVGSASAFQAQAYPPASVSPSLFVNVFNNGNQTKATPTSKSKEANAKDTKARTRRQRPAPKRKNATRASIAHLKRWLDANRQEPYPKKDEKQRLSEASGMSLTQVSTWFANARRRLKKETKARAWPPLSSSLGLGLVPAAASRSSTTTSVMSMSPSELVDVEGSAADYYARRQFACGGGCGVRCHNRSHAHAGHSNSGHCFSALAPLSALRSSATASSGGSCCGGGAAVSDRRIALPRPARAQMDVAAAQFHSHCPAAFSYAAAARHGRKSARHAADSTMPH